MNSIQKSEAIKSSLRKGFQNGRSKMAKRKCYGYTINSDGAYTGLNLPHAREKPATSPENFRHLAGEGCQCKRETTYCEEYTKNV